jgi:hypothetical protein
MTNWIFLSKGKEDPYINAMAYASGVEPVDTEEFVYDDRRDKTPIVLRGIMKKKIIKKCWRYNRDFYYMDTGYFGNEVTNDNLHGWKYWHRVVKNNLQHTEIIPRPPDRFRQFGKNFAPWKKDGRKILIAKPDSKPCRFYDVDLEQWTKNTVEEIKKYTDRPIVVRDRASARIERIVHNTLQEALDDDVFALVTFNSVAATEAIFHGIPAFTLAPANAASPVCLQDLKCINEPYYPDHDKLIAWASHLAYGQFHITELKSGKARRILEELK